MKINENIISVRSCDFDKMLCVHPARFLKYVLPFYNIMNERVKQGARAVVTKYRQQDWLKTETNFKDSDRVVMVKL